jgi:poly-beta-hydroxybutyrate-responsive repressor
VSGESGAVNGKEQRKGTAPPRTWLMPCLLMMLRSWNAYGFELARQLAVFGFGSVDPGTVYRTLREMEREGYVTSSWDTTVSSGPARRVYTITDAGIEALRLQAAMLDSYRGMLERFFSLYTGTGPAGPDAGVAADGAADQAPSSQRP